MAKKEIFSFWGPVIGALKNKKTALYFGLAFGIIQILISLILSTHYSSIAMLAIIILFILYILLDIMFLGVLVSYIHLLMKKKSYVSLDDETLNLRDVLSKGFGAFIVSLIWGILIVAIGGIVIVALFSLLFFILQLLISTPSLLMLSGLSALLLIILILMGIGGYYLHFLINAYYSLNFRVSDALKFKEIIRKAFSEKYLVVVLKSILMGICIMIVLSPFMMGYSTFESTPYKENFLNNILNIFLLLISSIIGVFSSFIFSYYSFEGYERTKSSMS